MSEQYKVDGSNDHTQLREMRAQLVSKVVLCTLQELLRDEGHTDLVNEVVATMTHLTGGIIKLELPEHELILNVCLTLTKHDYKSEIEIPDERYAMPLIRYFNMLKYAALTYWEEYKNVYPDLYRRILTALNKEQLLLTEDLNNKTTLYFTHEEGTYPYPNSKRCGIYCYYTQKN